MADTEQSSTSAAGGAPPEPSSAANRLLMHRLEAVEQENRRLKRQGTILMLVTAILLGVGVALVYTAARRGMPGMVPRVIEAREFVLRDSEGRIRGAWGADEEGAIRLVLQDYRNQTSIKLNLLDDGTSGLTFADSAGNPRLIMAVLPDETINLVLGDSRGVARTVLGLNPDGASTLVFAVQGGTARTGIGVDARGRSMLSVGQEVEEQPPDTTR